jgi:isoaspartyl peptidase/L-asparaginase-like protein (Ntn-hydrolase superfamily)
MNGKWTLIATWPFSDRPVREGAAMLGQGIEAESVEEAVAVAVEEDAAVESVGFGGWPNIHGEMSLDAAMMRGRDLAMGSVLGLEGFRNPVKVARLVMNKCRHHVLIDRGAADFADSMGCERADMLSPAARVRWLDKLEEWKANGADVPNHDTVGVLVLDRNDEIVVAMSTSGQALKMRGRVGDSALIGSGFYADNEVGAAAATGFGEDIMRGCLCFDAVERMRRGTPPKTAAEEAVQNLHHRLAGGGEVHNMALICMDRNGQVGGAANHRGFFYATASDDRKPGLVEVESCITPPVPISF